MIDTAIELTGGLISFGLQLLALWVVLELGCRIFFWVRERKGE